ncbi:MAG: anthranilate phosphoribosyltransferase [Ktedonobacterales bacterium]
MIREAIAELVAGAALSEYEAVGAMEEIMTGAATPAQVGSFLTALRIKGETVDEVAGLAQVMRDQALHVSLPEHIKAVDTCGTGGDSSGTFNVSTAAGLLVAGLGQPVAKHGNRAASSRCGSADVLEALGVRLELGPEQVAACIAEVGFGFMFAPTYHPAMRHVGPARREIGIRTVFNILGPLTSPAAVKYQVLGVAEARLLPLIGEVLLRLGCRRALVVHSKDGLDELSISAPTMVCEADGTTGEVHSYLVTPANLGLAEQPREAVLGGNAEENALAMRKLLGGEQSGALADMVALNAGAALYVTGRVPELRHGVDMARQHLLSGKARTTLDALVDMSRSFAPASV